MRKSLDLEMFLEKYKDKYLMRDDKITYQLRKYNLSKISQKILVGIMYKISSNFIKPVEINENQMGKTFIYSLDFEEIKNLINLDYRFESVKSKIEKKLEELVSTPISVSVFDDNVRKEVVKTNLIEKIVLNDTNNLLYIAIDERILPLYRATSDKFTLWGFEYISYTEKKYTPRLYELLIEFSKSIGTKNINGIISKTINIGESDLKLREEGTLYYELSIPKSYKFDNIKTQILETCKEEFLALDIDDLKKREHMKLFKSFNFTENYEKSRGRGRKGVESITFNFELLDKTKKLLTGKKGIELTNSEKLEKRKSEKKEEFYYSVGSIINRCNYNPLIKNLSGYNKNTGETDDQKYSDFTLRVLDIKNDVRDILNLEKIQDVAFEKALQYTLEESIINSDREEFEHIFRKNLEKNIKCWKEKTGLGKAKPRKNK